MNIQSKILIPLIIIFSLMTGVVLFLNYSNQQKFVEKFIEDQALQTASQYFDSVNTLMITGTMENREILRKKLMENKDIEEAHIIRGDAVKAMYGEGFDYESAKDELDKRGLKGEEIKLIQSFDKKRKLIILMPVRASSSYRGTNCLECHEVPEGTVLGAVKVTYSLERLDQEVRENSIYVTKILFGLFVLALVIVVVALRYIAVRKIKNIQQSIQSISQEMDLTRSISVKKNGDEISRMAEALDEMLRKIRGSLTQVKGATTKIVHGTDEISEITSATIADILEQKEETEKITEAVRKMSQSSEDVAANTQHSQNFTINVEAEVADGASKARSASEKINNLFQQVELVASIAEKLQLEAVKIADTVKVVDDITLKTKLLSFNASVEASRAGSSGLGFSVVANEIGMLAEETKNSNLEIARGAIEFQALMEKAVAAIKETKQLAGEGRGEVNVSFEAFKNVSTEMMKLKEVVESIANSTKQQSVTTKAVENNIQSIMELSNKTTQAAQRIGEVSSDFSTLAHELDELVNKFKI